MKTSNNELLCRNLKNSYTSRRVVKGNTEFPLKGDSEAPEGQSPYGQVGSRFIGNNLGGLLLLTIITSMLMSFICVTLTAVCLNQSIITQKEIERKSAINLTRAGFEYISNLLYYTPVDVLVQGTGWSNNAGVYSTTLPGHNDVTISLMPNANNQINVPWRIEVKKMY
jgi:hypothetical protein